ncbi:putative holin-like toxin [Phascolarctobacterium succinatutens]
MTDVGCPSREVGAMRVYEALSFMIAFGILVATIILACK